MFWKKKRQVPWDEVGAELGKRHVSEVEEQTQQMKDAFSGSKGEGIPNFDSLSWKYEFSIWLRFWVWYVANSPKLKQVGATQPLLDAYRKSCHDELLRVGWLSSSGEDLRKWEAVSEERFIAYKNAFDNPPSAPTITGTEGWIFAHHAFPGHPSPALSMAMNEHGSILFQSLVDLVQSLEAQHK